MYVSLNLLVLFPPLENFNFSVTVLYCERELRYLIRGKRVALGLLLGIWMYELWMRNDDLVFILLSFVFLVKASFAFPLRVCL
jgi:hypothetical protein